MKQFFEEPKLCLEQFTVTDQTLWTSGIVQDVDETDFVAIGSGKAIG